MRTRALAGAFAALLGILIGPLAFSAAAADVDGLHTVDQYAAALRSDPILVQQVVGAGDTAGARTRLAALAAKLPYPVHIALVGAPDDLQSSELSSAVASSLRRKVGTKGLWIVAVAGGTLDIQSDSSVDPTQLSLAYYDVMRAITKARGGKDYSRTTSVLDAEVVLRIATSPGFANYSWHEGAAPVLSHAEIEKLADASYGKVRSSHDGDYESHVGKHWMLGTVTGLGVLLLVQQCLRGWPGWRRRRDEERPDRLAGLRHATKHPSMDELHTQAGKAATELATALAAAGDPRHPEILEDATSAREAAEAELDGHYLDLVGALVLARTGLADVRRAAAESPGPRYRCCYLDPFHGEAVTVMGWNLGNGTVDIPVCRQCAEDIGRRLRPQVLHVDDDDSPAYFERGGVWARTGYGSLVEHFGAVVLADRAERR